MPNCIRCHKPIDATPFCPLCGAKQEKTNRKRKRGNGLGTAYKRKGQNTWTARVTIGFERRDDGKIVQRYRTKSGFRTQSAALEYCAALKAEKMQPPKAPTLSHYWALYESTKMDNLSHDRATGYKIAWDKLKPLHLKPVDTIKVADIQRVVSAKAKTHYPARDMRTVMSHLFKLAAADGFASKDIPSLVEIPPLEEKETQPFTAEEQRLLWQAYEQGVPYVSIPLIMIYTGIMPGELLRMRVEMINFDECTIAGLGLKTKTRKTAVVVIPEYIAPILYDVCAGRTSGKVFCINKDNLYKRYYEALEAAGCRRLTPYSCRHTTATALAIDANVAPQTLQKAMRWSSYRMASRYVHPSVDDIRDALTAIKKPL